MTPWESEFCEEPAGERLIDQPTKFFSFPSSFTLTLVDTLDTLVVLGDLDEFERAVGLVVKTVSFDHDIVVSVFETNIRMVG